jgi:hypothetical protein
MADLPKDLSLVRQTILDKDYFNLSVKNLKISQTYAIQFQWIYEDGQLGQWSPSYIFTTSNETSPAVPTSASVPETSTGSIPVTLSSFPTNARRVDVVITGGVFGTSKIAHSFSAAGVATIAAPAGFYTVQLRSVSPSGVTSSVGTSFTITVADVGETIQAPTNPNGFSSKRILAGIEVSWSGTYASSTFTGFEAINIYAGNSATATSGTYEQVGVLTGNNVKNTIVIPLGTYVVYGQAVYIHAAAVNKSGTVGTIQANVTNQALGPGKATDADINDGAVVISKLASDVLTVGNLKAGDINATSFIRAGTSSSARVELSSANISGGPLAGLHIYNSSGTAILSAPLTGGLSITGSGTFTGSITGASGQFDGDLGASGGDFRVRSGQITALSGLIGGWRINDSVLKNNANAYPNVLLDPVGSKIELRTNTGSSDTGNYIKIDTTAGLRIGTGADPKFTVDMSGNMVGRDATLYGKIITTGTNPNGLTGTLTIDGGYITQTAQLYLNTPFLYANTNSVYLQSTDGYFLLDTTGGLIVGQGNATGDLQMRITTVDNPPYPRGFQLFGLDNTEFRAPSQHVSNSYNSPTVVVGAGGTLMNGRTLWYGSSGTSATIQAAVGGSLGDIYFSTS